MDIKWKTQPTIGVMHIFQNEEFMDVRYSYPPDGKFHPFDTTTDLEYYINASGFTFLGEYANFDMQKKYNDILAVIPMGYKHLCILQRVLILNSDGVLWKNPYVDYDAIPENNNYMINVIYGNYVVEHKRLCNNLFKNTWGLKDSIWEKLQDAINFSCEYINRNNRNYCLISRLVSDWDWH